MNEEDLALLRKVFDALDESLGDTDPYLDDDLTDDEIREEEPLFWACQQVNNLVQKYSA